MRRRPPSHRTARRRIVEQVSFRLGSQLDSPEQKRRPGSRMLLQHLDAG